MNVGFPLSAEYLNRFQPTSAPILLTDDSIPKVEENLLSQCGSCRLSSQHGSTSSIAGLEDTFLKECAHGHVGSRTRSCKKCVRIQTPEDEVEELFFKGEAVKIAANDGLVFLIPCLVECSQPVLIFSAT